MKNTKYNILLIISTFCLIVAMTLPRVVYEINYSIEPIELPEKTEPVMHTTYIPMQVNPKPEVELVTLDVKTVTEPEPEPLPALNPEDVELLACVIYQEAGGDECCDDCRRRVADVVLNRVASPYFPNTIKEVLLERSQYGRFHWTGVVWDEKASYESEAHAVERAYRIAEEVLSGQHSELYSQGYIWQAEFIQSGDYKECCGIYFCK